MNSSLKKPKNLVGKGLSMYRIKNWTKFQHYKGRKLLWIKLHIALLSDVDYLSLTDKGKLTLVHCWMVGGEVWDQEKEVEPLLPSNQKLLKSLLKLDGNLRVNELKRFGYLVQVPNDYNNLKPIPDSNCLAGCLQVDVDVDVDVDKRTKPKTNGGFSSEFESWFVTYPRRVSKQTAWKAWKQTEGKRPPTEELILILKKHIDVIFKDRPVDKIPHPATWLRAESWEDEISISGKPQAKRAGKDFKLLNPPPREDTNGNS